MKHVVAIDLGGTKTAVAVMSGSGEIRARRVEPTDLEGPEAWLDQVRGLVASLLPGQRPDGIGVSVPAIAHDATGMVEWAPNLPGWVDVPLGRWLGNAYACPVALGNDGHFAALGEGWRGAGQGVHNFICVVLGTGVGSGLVLDGKLYAGACDVAGALGWSVFREDGPNLEQAVAGPGLEKRALAGAQSGVPTRLSALLQDGREEHPTQLLFDAALSGDRVALSIVEDAVDRLGRVLANVVSLLNLSKILLGGSVGLALVPWIPTLQRLVTAHAQPVSARAVEVEPAQLGHDAQLFGAARAVLDKIEG